MFRHFFWFIKTSVYTKIVLLPGIRSLLRRCERIDLLGDLLLSFAH